MRVELVDDKRAEIVSPILRALPEWFGIEDSTLAYIRGVQDKELLVVYDADKPIGFVSLKKHFEKCYEVYVMGVYPDYHGRGIGKLLVKHAEEYLRGLQVEFLQVKTLSESSSDPNYAKTRSFYLGCGFTPIEEFKTLWDEWNPCVLLIKRL